MSKLPFGIIDGETTDFEDPVRQALRAASERRVERDRKQTARLGMATAAAGLLMAVSLGFVPEGVKRAAENSRDILGAAFHSVKTEVMRVKAEHSAERPLTVVANFEGGAPKVS